MYLDGLRMWPECYPVDDHRDIVRQLAYSLAFSPFFMYLINYIHMLN